MPPSDLSGFTHVFRADVPSGVRRPRANRRARRPVSCVPCRTRKLKCDRVHPICGGCERRRDVGACKWDLPPGAVFASPGTVGVGSSEDAQPPAKAARITAGPKGEAQSRLQKLEEDVGAFMAAAKLGPVPASDSSPHVLPSNGSPSTAASSPYSPAQRSNLAAPGTGCHPSTSTSGTEIRYLAVNQWATILDSIRDIQGLLDDADADAGPGVDVDMGDGPVPSSSGPDAWREEPDLLFGPVESISIRQIMAALPARVKTDRLLGIYDSGRSTQTPILHTRQFRRQYDAFWLSPYATSLLWISILFSTLATAVLADTDLAGQEVAFAQKRFFTNKAAQCLVAGEYLKANKPFGVEALVMYITAHMNEAPEDSSYLWSAVGLAARLAQRMGYHRDPAQVAPAGGRPRITPFQAEMRRRCWFAIEAFDVMFSLQLGIPPIIQPDQCDVGLPCNLRDEDFDEDVAFLPPSRPEVEPTKALYCCYKGRLVRLLRRIVLSALGVSAPEYDVVLSFHKELEGIRANIPPTLLFVRPRDGGPPVEDQAALHNFGLEIMYLKTLCLLHRPYLTRRRSDPACELSRRTCRQAALKMLDLYADMEVEVKLDDKLADRGYLLKSLTTHDFLMAAMVLCLDVSETSDLAPQDREQEVYALQCTYANWNWRRAKSKDAAHATRVLGAMLRKVSQPAAAAAQWPQRPKPPARTSNLRHLLEPIPEPPPPPLRPTLPLTPGHQRSGSSGMAICPAKRPRSEGREGEALTAGFPAPPPPPPLPLPDPLGPGDVDELEGLLGHGGEIDWNMLDSYIYDRDTAVTDTGTAPGTQQHQQQQQQQQQQHHFEHNDSPMSRGPARPPLPPPPPPLPSANSRNLSPAAAGPSPSSSTNGAAPHAPAGGTRQFGSVCDLMN